MKRKSHEKINKKGNFANILKKKLVFYENETAFESALRKTCETKKRER